MRWRDLAKRTRWREEWTRGQVAVWALATSSAAPIALILGYALGGGLTRGTLAAFVGAWVALFVLSLLGVGGRARIRGRRR